MKLLELLEEDARDLVIIYPGRFHPFHIGHGKVYKYLKQKYSNAKVFISTSGKTDSEKSPFTFDEKKKMMMLAGVDSSAIVQSKSPYQSIEITEMFDPDKTVVVFAVSEKDMENEPRFDFSNGVNFKKNGEPAHMQKWEGMESADTVRKHSYIATTPTFPFTIRGAEINSASQIRNMISKSDDTELSQILQDLYNVADIPQDVMDIFKRKIGNSTMNENWSEDLTSAFLIEDNTMSISILQALTESEFSALQIKMAFGILNDPRYKQGNYSGAVSAIEKVAKGLSNYPSVANALKRANEAYNPETGLDPNVDTTEWDELIAKAKKKQEKEYANSEEGKRDPAYRHYHQYKTQDEEPGQTVKVTNIQWDADDMDDIKQALSSGDLQKDMIVPIPSDLDDEEVDEYISDYITDKTGWTHKGFETSLDESYSDDFEYGDASSGVAGLEYGQTEEEMAKALGMSQDDFWELAERVGQDQYGGLTKDNYEDVMTHIVDNGARYKQIDIFRKAGEFDESELLDEWGFLGPIVGFLGRAAVGAAGGVAKAAGGALGGAARVIPNVGRVGAGALGSLARGGGGGDDEDEEQDVSGLNVIPSWLNASKKNKGKKVLSGEEQLKIGKVKSSVYAPSGRHTDVHGNTRDLKTTESEERPYIVVHVKKGKYETHATSSYDAAKNAAKHWGLKSTAGINAHLADVEHVAEDNGYANDQHEMLEYIHHVLQECGDGNVDNAMVEQAIGYVEDIREQHFDADGSTKSESVTEDKEEILYVTLTKLANKLKDMHDTLQWTRDEPSSDNRGSIIDDILDEIKEVMGELKHLKGYTKESVTEDKGQADRYHNETLGLLIKKLHRIHDGIDNGYTTETIQKTLKLVMTELESLKLAFSNKAYESVNESNMTKDDVKNTFDGAIKSIEKWAQVFAMDTPEQRAFADAIESNGGYDSITTFLWDDLLTDLRKAKADALGSELSKTVSKYGEDVEEGVMSTIGQGIDNVAVGAGRLAKKGAKKAAVGTGRLAKKGAMKGVDATKKGLKKLSKIGSKSTSYDPKTGKETTTLGMANAKTESSFTGRRLMTMDKLKSVGADIKDYVDDHKEHFDAYPQDVEVDDKMYDWDEYWSILDKVYPDAYDNQYANESTGDADIEKMQDAYKYNEDRNAHSENILMLAHSFATRGEIKAIEGLLKITKQQGYVTPEQSEIMYNSIHKKYIGELFPIEESKKRMHISPDIAKAHTLKHTFSPIDKEKYQERDGLEGPIMTKAGKVLYYDNVEGAYLDPDTDIYLSHEDWKNLSESEYIDHFDSMAAEIQKEGILHYSDAKGTPKYSEGYKAAKDGIKYDENPYSGIKKLQWSRGHNDERADRLSAAGEPNYGARGQFESKK